jgi:hypothetical protein
MTCSGVEVRWEGTIIMAQQAREVGTGAFLIEKKWRGGRVGGETGSPGRKTGDL